MRAVKWIVIVGVVYVGIVTLFESLIGYFQPANAQTLVITTTDEDGNAHARVVARLESGGQLYVAANHWPRAWYRQALDKPEVGVALGAESQPHMAVPVTGDEAARVASDHPLPLGFRFVTGFPPRYFLRLDPSGTTASAPAT